MKKVLSVICIILLMLCICGCKKAMPEAPYTVPETELDNVSTTHGIVCGNYPSTASQVAERSQYIAIAVPQETYLEAECQGGVIIRRCLVEKVIKGDLTEGSQISVCEFADILENGIRLYGYSPLMAKSQKYLIFFNDDNLGAEYFDLQAYGVYCLNTDINEKIRPISQFIYSQILKDYSEYFTGSDFRIMTDTEKEFQTDLFTWSDLKSELEFEGEKYACFFDRYYPQEHYFKSDIRFTYSGKTALDQSGYQYRVYLSENDGFDGRMIYTLAGGYLYPMIKIGTEFENAEIEGLRIYQKSNNDTCFEVPKADVQKLVSELKIGNFPEETTNDMFDDDAVLLEFYDKNGVCYSSTLYIEKGKLFGRSIGRELTDRILSFISEQNETENLHLSDTYR